VSLLFRIIPPHPDERRKNPTTHGNKLIIISFPLACEVRKWSRELDLKSLTAEAKGHQQNYKKLSAFSGLLAVFPVADKS
jgi:hypothetical protein